MPAKEPTKDELDPLELCAWRGLLTVHAALTRELDAELEQRAGLGLNAYDVLLQLAQAPEARLRMTELADRVLLSRSGVTRIVDGLVRDGLVERRRAANDGRGLEARLTRPGRERLRRLNRIHIAGVRGRFLERLSRTQLEQLADVWGTLTAEADGT